MDRGRPISYLALAEGTPVFTADEAQVGDVARVLALAEKDIFEGLILNTPNGDRFVDADHVGDLYERAVMLTVTAEEAEHLPEPRASPAALGVHPEDTVERSPGERVGDAIRRTWDRISGNY